MKKKSSRKKPKTTVRTHLPGGRKLEDIVARMIRVDHAGEFGAQRIYAGQLAVLGESASANVIRRMAKQEDAHLAAFERLINEKHARPAALNPIWRVAGYILGAATATLGEKTAMACTVAIEETIVEHYKKQLDVLGDDEPALRKLIHRFCAEEDEHKRAGLEFGAEDIPYYAALRRLIRAASKTAIWLSERV